MARTLGIPARLNPHDRSMEYMKNGKFIPVSAETEKNASIFLKASEDTQWKYFQNWSIAKLEAGKYSTLKLETENFRDQMMKLPLEAEITGSLPQTDCQMEIYLPRSIILRFRSEK